MKEPFLYKVMSGDPLPKDCTGRKAVVCTVSQDHALQLIRTQENRALSNPSLYSDRLEYYQRTRSIFLQNWSTDNATAYATCLLSIGYVMLEDPQNYGLIDLGGYSFIFGYKGESYGQS